IYEIPAGKLNEGEEEGKAAARELEEETGYRAKLVHFLDLYPSPGYTNEIIHIYLAKSYEFVGQNLDEGEFLSTEFVPLNEVLKLIENGEICDAKTVSAIYKYVSLK
ncbi:MAG: NUDIX hydrolase, partial [Clostridia bacterium]|nr:NUDIX hydrolase [Clostridia bacterium]